MKPRALTLVSLSTLALCLSQPVMAQRLGGGPGPMDPMTFSEADLDGNGEITEQEFYQARAQHMAERSQQGYPMRMAGQAPNFDEIDENGDGSVGPSELAQAHSRHMQRMRGSGMGPPAAMGPRAPRQNTTGQVQ